MSTVRSNGSAERPRVQSRIWSRVSTRRGRCTKQASRSNSALVSCRPHPGWHRRMMLRASRSIDEAVEGKAPRPAGWPAPHWRAAGWRGPAPAVRSARRAWPDSRRRPFRGRPRDRSRRSWPSASGSGCCRRARSRRQIESPSSPGSIRSSISRSGRRRCSTASIALPLFGAFDLKSLPPHELGEQPADFRVVFHDQKRSQRARSWPYCEQGRAPCKASSTVVTHCYIRRQNDIGRFSAAISG